jgi:ketosteroid isomerase-like protein
MSGAGPLKGSGPAADGIAMEHSENAAILFEAYDEFNRTGEIPEELFDPEVEFVQMDGFAGTGTNKGVEGVRNVLTNLLANFESLKMRPRDVVSEEDDEVMIRVAVSAHAKGSNIQVKETMWHSWTMRDARIARWRAFAEESEAMEALGQTA